MSDDEFVRRIAELWIDLGGDDEGVDWLWRKLKYEIQRQQKAEVAHNADGEAIHNYARLVAHVILAALPKGRI